MRVLGVITARGGSKGIPGKNLRSLAGKPLLQYTAEAARASSRLTRVVLSTDDQQIAAVGRRLGLDVPFLRPEELARDKTPTLPVIQHTVRWLEERGDRFDAVFVLQPTNPLRRPSDIDGSIELLERTGADSVFAVVDVAEKHPAKIEGMSSDGRMVQPPFARSFGWRRRQDLPTFYVREGSVYLTRTRVVMEENSLRGGDCRAWIVPVERACSIDTPFDLFIAEQMFKHLTAPVTTPIIDQADLASSESSGRHA